MSPDSDTPRLSDIPAALGLLTRLPLPMGSHAASGRGARAAWAWPVAGAITGAIAGGIGAIAMALGVTAPIAAGLALGTGAVITGALHEDGLADTADGLWGGWTPEQRLEIMKDSRIGTYGVIALILSFGLRWTALATLFAFDAGWGAMIAAGALSRVPMAALSHRLPPARPSGLSAKVGRPSQTTVLLALLAAVLLAIPGGGGGVLPAAVLGGLAAWALASIARRRIGGQTGDILGASQQLAELAALISFAAVATA